MSFCLVLNIDIAHMPNEHKGKFLAEIHCFLSDQEFAPFRSAVSKRADVYHSNDKEYDNMIKIRKIISTLMTYKGNFSIYKVQEDSREEIAVRELETIMAQFKTIHKLPHFKYNPNVYENGIISFNRDICEVCHNESHFILEISYGESDLEAICVDCVANGRAAREYDVFFNSYFPQTFNDSSRTEELTLRTPGFLSWQEIRWMEHCQDFCAYIKKVNWDDIAHLEEEVMDDLLYEASLYKDELDDIKKYLNGYMEGHLFQCLHCGKHRITTDLP